MLDGDDEAIHSSTIAQQPQVWSIKEHHYPPSNSSVRLRPLSHVPSSKSSVGRSKLDRPLRRESSHMEKPIDLGPSLHGHLPQDIQFDEPALRDVNTSASQRQSPSPLSPYSPPPSPPQSPFKSLPSPTVVATYTDRLTGLPTQSTYSTWTGPSHGVNMKPIQHRSSSNGLPTGVAKERKSHNQMARHVAATRTIGHTHEDPTITGYADPYGFSSPSESLPGSHASSSVTSLDGSLVDMKPPSHLVNDIAADDALDDIVLTGKVGSQSYSVQAIRKCSWLILVSTLIGTFCMGAVSAERQSATMGWHDQYRQVIRVFHLIIPR